MAIRLAGIPFLSSLFGLAQRPNQFRHPNQRDSLPPRSHDIQPGTYCRNCSVGIEKTLTALENTSLEVDFTHFVLLSKKSTLF